MSSTQIKSWRNWFWQEEDDRLRAFWRIALTYTAMVLIALGIQSAVRVVSGGFVLSADTAPVEVLRLAILLLVLWLVSKYVDKRPFSDYGLTLNKKPFWIEFLFGLALGVVMITAVFSIQYGLGWISIVGTYVKSVKLGFWLALLIPLINLIAAALFTELFFRGYLIVNLAESFNFMRALYQPNPSPGSLSKFRLFLNDSLFHQSAVMAAWICGTAFFLWYRLSDNMESSVFILNILRASFMLTLPFIMTRNLGMPLGINLGWTFFASNIFGLRVQSLILTKTSVLAIVLNGPENYTGGTAGPESGLIGMGAIVIASGIVMAWVKYRQNHMPPGFDPWYFEYKPLKR